MTIIRVQRKKKDFFVAKTEALNQKDLSFKAKGLWAYAMSRPDDWHFIVEHLITVSKEKKTAIYSALKELMDLGYCLREQKQNAKGRWIGTDYIIFETIEDAENFKKCLPHSGFPLADNPLPDNQPLPSIDPRPSINKEREEAQAPPPPSFEIHKRVKMKSEKYQKLVQDFGEPKIQEMMERLDEYADINPKRFKQYACHAAVIRKWIRDDLASGKIIDSKKIQPSLQQTRAEIEGENRSWGTKMERILWQYSKEGKIRSGANGWEFFMEDHTMFVAYTEKDFIERCTKILKAMGIML